MCAYVCVRKGEGRGVELINGKPGESVPVEDFRTRLDTFLSVRYPFIKHVTGLSKRIMQILFLCGVFWFSCQLQKKLKKMFLVEPNVCFGDFFLNSKIEM